MKELESQKWLDRTIQELLRRNQAIEKELKEMKDRVELLESILPFCNSILDYPQIAQAEEFSTLPWDNNKSFSCEEIHCSPYGSWLPFNYECVVDQPRLQALSSEDWDSSDSSSTNPAFPSVFNLSSTGYTCTSNSPTVYTTMATLYDGDCGITGGTYSEVVGRDEGNVTTNGYEVQQQLLSQKEDRT